MRLQEPGSALELQRYALTFLLAAAPDSVLKVVSHADMAALNYQNKVISITKNTTSQDGAPDGSQAEVVASFYQKVLAAITAHINTTQKLDQDATLPIVEMIAHCDIHKHRELLQSTLECCKSVMSPDCYITVSCSVEMLHASLQVRHCGQQPNIIVTALATLNSSKHVILR